MNKPNYKKTCFFAIISLLLITAAIICGGCQSPQERNGVSLLPQNRPMRGSPYNNNYSNMGGITF
jgi:hypothetical protein